MKDLVYNGKEVSINDISFEKKALNENESYSNSCFHVDCYETKGISNIENADKCTGKDIILEEISFREKKQNTHGVTYGDYDDYPDACIHVDCYETRGMRNQDNNKFNTVHFELTYDCNHECFYCFNPKNQHHKGISKTQIETNLVFLRKITDSIVLTGGEPFVYPNLVLYALKEATTLNFKRISINTNASLLNYSLISEMYQINPTTAFLVSIPTTNKKNYYKITKRNDLKTVLDNLKSLIVTFGNKNVTANMVIQQFNKNDINKTSKDIFKIGIRFFTQSFMSPSCESISLSIPESEIDNIFKDLLKSKETYSWFHFSSTHAFPLCRVPDEFLYKGYKIPRCGMGDSVIRLNPLGIISSCPQLGIEKYDINLSEFNSKKDILKASDVLKKISEPCDKCSLLSICRAGCIAENASLSNNLYMAPQLARKMSKEEIIRKEILLGVSNYSEDVCVTFEYLDENYSKVSICGIPINERILKVSNNLVEQIQKNNQDINKEKLIKIICHLSFSQSA